MHATPLNTEVTMLDFLKSNPLCSTRGGSYPFCVLHLQAAGTRDMGRLGKRLEGIGREREYKSPPARSLRREAARSLVVCERWDLDWVLIVAHLEDVHCVNSVGFRR